LKNKTLKLYFDSEEKEKALMSFLNSVEIPYNDISEIDKNPIVKIAMNMEEEEKKKCVRCGHERPLSIYPKDSKSPDGRRVVCKICLRKERILKRKQEEENKNKN